MTIETPMTKCTHPRSTQDMGKIWEDDTPGAQHSRIKVSGGAADPALLLGRVAGLPISLASGNQT